MLINIIKVKQKQIPMGIDEVSFLAIPADNNIHTDPLKTVAHHYQQNINSIKTLPIKKIIGGCLKNRKEFNVVIDCETKEGEIAQSVLEAMQNEINFLSEIKIELENEKNKIENKYIEILNKFRAIKSTWWYKLFTYFKKEEVGK